MDAEEKRKLEQQDIRAVMSTAEGRRLLWGIIERMAGTFIGTFSGEALGSAFNEGRRAVGLELMVRMQTASAADYLRALNEALTEREAEAMRKRLSEDSEE